MMYVQTQMLRRKHCIETVDRYLSVLFHRSVKFLFIFFLILFSHLISPYHHERVHYVTFSQGKALHSLNKNQK